MLGELLQPTHFILILAIVIFLFGGRWFSRAGLGFRDAIRNFRVAIRGTRDD